MKRIVFRLLVLTLVFAMAMMVMAKEARLQMATAISNLQLEKKSFMGHQYAHIAQPMSWIKAKAYCAALGGHLVTISNQEEQDFVASLPGKLDKSNRVWIGFSDEDLNGTWE